MKNDDFKAIRLSFPDIRSRASFLSWIGGDGGKAFCAFDASKDPHPILYFDVGEEKTNYHTLKAVKGSPIGFVQIPGFFNYFISEEGFVYNAKLNRVMTFDMRGSGKKKYKTVILHKDNKSRKYSIHRLLMLTFVGPPPFEGALVRHLDDNPDNNSIENLAYGTHQDNADDSLRNGNRLSTEQMRAIQLECKKDPAKSLRGEDIVGSKLKEEDIKTIRERLKTSYKGILRDLALEFNCSPRTIAQIRDNLIWKHVESAA